MTIFKHALIVAFVAWLAVVGGRVPASAASLPDFTELVEQQGPAVVNISTTQSLAAHLSGLPDMDESEPLLEFFRRFAPQLPGMPGLAPEDQSLGSGFIISKDGYILTNAHVVADAEEITVRLIDKREFHARVIGTDKRSDMALIKIDAEDLPVVVLGKPDKLKVGEWVVAIGSPFGFDHSVTAGIVSAKGRTLPDENFVPFIQTDVAINPGNSGGPLFNMAGEVVGINSQIYSQTGGFMGLSFAIPIDVAMDVQQQLRTDGRVRRGRIGVAVQEVTRALAESFGLPGASGALVSAVEPSGSAASAGILQGDVIVQFAGKAINSANDLPLIVAATQPGKEVDIRFFREGTQHDLKVKVGEWSDEEPVQALHQREKTVSRPDRLGLVVVKPEAGRKGRPDTGGVLIKHVSGAAARANLQEGDLIVSTVMNGRQLAQSSPEAFNKQVEALVPGQSVTLLVRRAEASFYVSLKVDQ